MLEVKLVCFEILLVFTLLYKIDVKQTWIEKFCCGVALWLPEAVPVAWELKVVPVLLQTLVREIARQKYFWIAVYQKSIM